MNFPTYFKNHDNSAFVCCLADGAYLEVRRLNVSHQLSFGNNPAIHTMVNSNYLPATEMDFKKAFAKQAGAMGKMFELIEGEPAPV